MEEESFVKKIYAFEKTISCRTCKKIKASYLSKRTFNVGINIFLL